MALLDSAALPKTDTEALLEQARAEVEQMAELVDDVLFLSELESGRAVVALGGTPVGPVVEETIAALTPSAERAGLDLVTAVEPGVSVPLRPRMVRVLIENLIANAIRYAGDGAQCTVSARREGGVVLLSVADTGRGVLESDLPRLFERFFRGDLTRTTRGTGLGLAIVKHIVSSAGGQVQASSGPDGRGLEVRCVFPT
jgi:signal transduction histidine kinase